VLLEKFLRRKKNGEEKFCEEAHRFTIPWEPSLTAVTNWNRGQLKAIITFYTQLCESEVSNGQKIACKHFKQLIICK